MEWVVPLRLLWLLEHLRTVLKSAPFKNISWDKEHTNKIILIQEFLRIKTLFNMHLDNPLLSELNKSFPYFCLNSQRYPLFVLRLSQSEERWSRWWLDKKKIHDIWKPASIKKERNPPSFVQIIKVIIRGRCCLFETLRQEIFCQRCLIERKYFQSKPSGRDLICKEQNFQQVSQSIYRNKNRFFSCSQSMATWFDEMLTWLQFDLKLLT